MKTPTELPPMLRGGAFFCDNSSFEALDECERKGYYFLGYQRQLAGKADALNFGGAVHEGLKVRYASGGMAHDTMSEQVHAAIEHLKTNPITPGDWRTPELLMDTIQQHSRTYPVEDFELVSLGGNRLVELPFAVPLGVIRLPAPLQLQSIEIEEAPGIVTGSETEALMALATGKGRIVLKEYTEIPVIWTGRIDMVIERLGLWIADHKTTSRFGPTYWNQFTLSSQFCGYKYAVQRTLQKPVRGVMINCLAIRKPTKTGKGTELARNYIDIPDHWVTEWQTNTLQVLQEFFGRMAMGMPQPMKKSACRNKWQKDCQYKGVCTMEPDQRDIYLSTGDFKDVTWSPLNSGDSDDAGE